MKTKKVFLWILAVVVILGLISLAGFFKSQMEALSFWKALYLILGSILNGIWSLVSTPATLIVLVIVIILGWRREEIKHLINRMTRFKFSNTEMEFYSRINPPKEAAALHELNQEQMREVINLFDPLILKDFLNWENRIIKLQDTPMEVLGDDVYEDEFTRKAYGLGFLNGIQLFQGLFYKFANTFGEIYKIELLPEARKLIIERLAEVSKKEAA